MNILFLDDMEVRHIKAAKVFAGHVVTRAYSAAAAIDALKMKKFDLVCLDHDLEDEHYGADMSATSGTGTGREVAQFMVDELEQKNRPSKVILHTLNPSGADHMRDTLQRGGYEMIRKPFTQW